MKMYHREQTLISESFRTDIHLPEALLGPSS